MRKLFILTLGLLWASGIYAQDLTQNFKNWYLGSVNLRFNKNNSLLIGHLSSFDVQGYQHKFTQNRVLFNHKFDKKWTGSLGYSYSNIKGTTSNTPYHRIEAQIAHRARWNHWRMTNSVRVEKYFPQLSKFGARAVITNKISYYDRNWPFRISPFIRNQVFYYQGGKEVTYWLNPEDIEAGEDAFVKAVPNGWHRYRFTTGIRARLTPDLNMTLFYTLQREFNTGLSPFTEINVPNQSGTKIRRPFNNYSLLGISLVYTIKFY